MKRVKKRKNHTKECRERERESPLILKSHIITSATRMIAYWHRDFMGFSHQRWYHLLLSVNGPISLFPFHPLSCWNENLLEKKEMMPLLLFGQGFGTTYMSVPHVFQLLVDFTILLFHGLAETCMIGLPLGPTPTTSSVLVTWHQLGPMTRLTSLCFSQLFPFHTLHIHISFS